MKMVLEKLLEQGLTKESNSASITKIDEQDKSQSGLMAVQQKLFGQNNDGKPEPNLSSEELKQLINKHEEKLSKEITDPKGN
ncbi:hypothetical protein, partial [Klebsiella pneumoniae]|uniref:hypothetical protein n=1 Tax=Klebsiella pneumoniae TaxID=573 RepID=UPI0013C2D18E